MKKILLLSFLLLATLGCSNDNDDDIDMLSNIIGTWAVGTTENFIDYTIWVTFNADNTYTIYDLTDESKKQNGTFNYKGKRIVMNGNTGACYDVQIKSLENINAELSVKMPDNSTLLLHGKKKPLI